MIVKSMNKRCCNYLCLYLQQYIRVPRATKLCSNNAVTKTLRWQLKSTPRSWQTYVSSIMPVHLISNWGQWAAFYRAVKPRSWAWQICCNKLDVNLHWLEKMKMGMPMHCELSMNVHNHVYGLYFRVYPKSITSDPEPKPWKCTQCTIQDTPSCAVSRVADKIGSSVHSKRQGTWRKEEEKEEDMQSLYTWRKEEEEQEDMQNLYT